MKNKNRQFFCYKFSSDRLKKFNYDITIDFNKAKLNGEIIAIADNQILRTIRDIKHINFSKEVVEELYALREELKHAEDTSENIKKLKQTQLQINHLLFFPEYVTVVINKPKHYEHIFKNGFKINGVVYRRLSCSAGQARNSTVVFCTENIIDEVKERLNNGRDLQKLIAPSKLNAYFGLYSSATSLVSEPKFVVVPDYMNTVKFMCNFVTETDYDSDDIIDIKEVEQEINRTDGMGLVSPKLAKQWAEDLNLDYVPSQFVVRQSFLKGLVTVFDIHKFCKEKNNGNYLIKTVYKDENGEFIYADLRNYDLIISESQFKLWDSYKSVEHYIENYHKNKLYWGITQFSPKEYEDTFNLNYQFIQSLNLSKDEVQELCSFFVDWVSGVSMDNIYYTLLFLTGMNNTEDRIKEYLRSWEIYWIKALIVNHKIIKDKYVRKKTRQYLTNIIKQACLGCIPVKGNFQYIVSDPYAYMEHVCGLEPKGLLNANEYYSNYWNTRGISIVNGMRSPLTYRSEHTIMNLKKNNDTEDWYKYCNHGIILNWFGYETVKLAGADFDGDIIATTSNKIIINGVYRDELPVVYNPPKPQKIIPTEQDLFMADIFGMGSIIGSITNKGSGGYALLNYIEEIYGKDSIEYSITHNRIKQTCKAQSAQIDKKMSLYTVMCIEIW